MKSVSMTTNGVTLSHKLKALKEAGLSGINISLDTLQHKKFEFITRRRGWDKVMRSIEQSLEADISPLKVCTQQCLSVHEDQLCSIASPIHVALLYM